MTCPCEACKVGRDLARRHRRQLQAIEGRINASKDAVWCQGDGNDIRVQAMSGSHLFYAIAKGYRGEYPLQYARSLIHLENEAMRRLIAGVQ